MWKVSQLERPELGCIVQEHRSRYLVVDNAHVLMQQVTTHSRYKITNIIPRSINRQSYSAMLYS